ncbi:MAG TPA: hypothetical protein VG456_14810 [Candidatus Sulfopaludibacter sp.]|jgi:hypothetical protein|nr:hypothetical protein [Candidatus Sulfopaludibacter sp.]
MNGAEITARLLTASLGLDRVCRLLEKPVVSNLDECLGLLHAAVGDLSACEPEVRKQPADPVLLREAVRLQAAIRRAGFLLKTAADYHENWFQILRSSFGGYTAEGAPAELAWNTRVYVQG